MSKIHNTTLEMMNILHPSWDWDIYSRGTYKFFFGKKGKEWVEVYPTKKESEVLWMVETADYCWTYEEWAEQESVQPTQVKVKLLTKTARLPKKQSSGAAAFDLHFDAVEEKLIRAKRVSVLPTGVALELPPGWEAQIRGRSGLSKEGLFVVNSPGTIDSDYRGEIHVILYNLRDIDALVEPGNRIAQMVIQRLPEVELVQTEELGETDRGTNGFGSTGA